MQKRNKTNATWPFGGSSRAVAPAVIFAVAQHTIAYDAYAEPSRAESFDLARLVLNGDWRQHARAVHPSNLLFEYSFYLPRSFTHFHTTTQKIPHWL